MASTMARTTTSTVTALVMLALSVSAEPPAPTTQGQASGQAHAAHADLAAAPSAQHQPQPQPEPNYHYRYAVASRKTGDVKGAWEKRAGEDVWGAYYLRDPDGRWRTVHYEADGTGFYATVQRRPLYRGGRVEEAQPGQPGQQQQQQGELHGVHGANTVLPLDDATWKSVLAAARQSSREDNHPALQRATKPAGGLEGAASVASYSTTRAPAGFGFSSAHSTTRAPRFGFSSSAAAAYSTTRAPRYAHSAASYATTRAPAFGFSSPAASVSSYSTTRAPAFGFSGPQGYAGYPKKPLRPLRQQTMLSGPAFAGPYTYRSQPLRAGRPPPSYSSAYASEPFHAHQQQQMVEVEEDTDESTTAAPSNEAYPNEDDDDEGQESEQTTEEPDAERFAEPESSPVSAPYRAPASNDVSQQQEDENQYGNEAAQDEDKDEEEHDDDKLRDEESGADDGGHSPDDDHESVPEQALQAGSQVRQEHEALQVAPERYAHHLHESQRAQAPQEREPGLSDSSMEHLLGPAWAQVSSHSSLFEGQDFPLFRQGLGQGLGQDYRGGEQQGTQHAPTWAQRERADRTKGRRGAPGPRPGPSRGVPQGQGGQGDAARALTNKGAGRLSGSPRGTGSSGSSDRTRGAADVTDKDLWGTAPDESTWSFGSKVRGKEDPSFQQPPLPSAPKRGRHQDRGPVLFEQQQVEASTLAGDRRLPPRGFSLPAQQYEDKAAWPPARQQQQQQQQQQQRAKPAAYSSSGWVPLPPPLRAAESYRDPSPVTGRPGPPRGRRRAPTRPLAVGDAPRSSAFWKQAWF